MSPHDLEGSCLCGGVRFRVSGEATNRCYCHCRSCRMAAGAPFVAWVTFPTAGFQLLAGALREHRSSERVLRGFCPTCGTSLTYAHEARPDQLDVSTVAFDDASALAPQSHIWVSDKLPWVSMTDGLPQHAGWPRRPD